jgi:zinc protease
MRRSWGAVAGAFVLLIALPAAAVEVKAVTSPGGIEAWLVEDHTIPVIALEWSFTGAGSQDPDGKQGLANMAARTMDEGAGPLDARTFQARLLDKAIALGFDAGTDFFRGSLRTLSQHRDEALDLTRLSLTEPRFDQEAIDRMRAAVTASLRRDLSDPERLAQRAFFANAFPGSVYGRPVRGTVESIARIGPEDLRTFARAKLGRDRLTVAAAGDIAPDALGKALDAVFGGLPKTSAATPAPETAPSGAGQTLLIERPTAQTVIVMGQAGVKRADPDWYAAVVLNHILGGDGFSSRLMEEVREKRGLTYGVSSDLVPFEHAALVMAGGSSANAKAGQALDLIRAEWERIARDGVSDQELADAKTFLTGSFPLQFDSTSAIARILLQIKRDKLGIDYLDRRNGLLQAVTKEDVRRVAKRLLDPAKLLTVLVGKPAGVTPTKVLPGVE